MQPLPEKPPAQPPVPAVVPLPSEHRAYYPRLPVELRKPCRTCNLQGTPNHIGRKTWRSQVHRPEFWGGGFDGSTSCKRSKGLRAGKTKKPNFLI